MAWKKADWRISILNPRDRRKVIEVSVHGVSNGIFGVRGRSPEIYCDHIASGYLVPVGKIASAAAGKKLADALTQLTDWSKVPVKKICSDRAVALPLKLTKGVRAVMAEFRQKWDAVS